MHFRDQHNHNSQPQLLDVIPHTLDVLAFSLDFLTLQVSCLLVFSLFLLFLLPWRRSVRFETWKKRRPTQRQAGLTIQIVQNFYMEHLCFWARGGANTSTKSVTGGKPFWWELREWLQSGEEKRKKCRQ